MTLRHAATTVTLTTLALATMACGGTPSAEDSSPSQSGSTPTGPGISEAFGAAAWQIETTEAHSVLDVQPDRLFTREDKTLSAYSASGELAWRYELPTTQSNIEIKNGLVIITGKAIVDDIYPDKKKTVLKMIVLFQENGSVKEERDLKELTDKDEKLKTTTRFGNTTYQIDRTLNTIDSDGNIATIDMKQYNMPEYQNIQIIGRTPFWTPRAAPAPLTSPNWTVKDFPGIEEDEIFDIRPMAIDREFDLVIVQVDRKEGPNSYFTVRGITGEIAYQITCPAEPTTSYSQAHADSAPEAVARHSPNGKYSVWGSMRLTETAGECIGGGDQDSVWFTAVDDNGTAYGDAEPTRQIPEEIVIVPTDASPQVSEASIPIGTMSNGLTIHTQNRDGDVKGEMITGNPIK